MADIAGIVDFSVGGIDTLAGKGLKNEVRPDRLWTLAELSEYLNMPISSLYKMVPSISVADGKMRVRHQWRFDPHVVKVRVRSGMFGRGLDEHGKPTKEK